MTARPPLPPAPRPLNAFQWAMRGLWLTVGVLVALSGLAAGVGLLRRAVVWALQ